MRTRYPATLVAKYLLAGCVLQALVALVCAVPHGDQSRVVTVIHNPRSGDDPILMTVDERLGLTYVYGMGRPGTFLDRHPEQMHDYQGDVWWPKEAIAFNHSDGNFAMAVGWPFRSVAGWCETISIDIPPDGFEVHWQARNGILFESQTRVDRREQFPFMMPVGPLWIGTIGNTLLYAAATWLLIFVRRLISERVRRFRSRCVKCAYPSGSGMVCPECGHRTSVVLS